MLVSLSILLVGTVRANTDPAGQWQSIPIEVRGLPGDCRFVVASCPIDLTSLLAKRGINGAVDGHSIRLDERSGMARSNRSTPSGRRTRSPA